MRSNTAAAIRDRATSLPGAEPGGVWWIGIAFVMFWAGLLAHEAAHYLVATLLLDDWTRAVPSWQRGVTAAAGPLLTLAIVLGCAVRARSLGRLRYVLVATAIGAASRIVLIGIPTMLGKGNDEGTIGLAFGTSPKVLWFTEAVLTAILIAITVRKSGVSRQASFLCCGSVVVGWISAFTFGRAVGLPI